jgi:hypothetical protein
MGVVGRNEGDSVRVGEIGGRVGSRYDTHLICLYRCCNAIERRTKYTMRLKPE